MCSIEDNNNVWCVVMAGDSGFRPLPMIPLRRTLVVTFAPLVGAIRSGFPDLPQENILVEPHNRGTATCIAYAMYTLLLRNPDAIMAVVPSDLWRWDALEESRVLSEAIDFVRDNDVLMTIGVKPTSPDTHFGYIQPVSLPVVGTPVKVKTFAEKPSEELARILYDSGEFLWNSGIFIWKADTIRQEYERYLPLTVSLFSGWQVALSSSERDSFLEKAYLDCSKISVDHAILERTRRAWVYPINLSF